MSASGPTIHHTPDNVNTPAALAKIRALARPRFEPKRFAKTISPVEISVVVVLVVAIIGIVLVYSYSVLPGQVKFAQLSSAKASKAKTVDELRVKVSDPAAIRQAYDQSVASLERFRGEILKPRLPGRVAIVREIDRLTSATGVRLMGGVTFATSVPTDEEDASGKKSTSKRGSSSNKKRAEGVFSSMRFSLTVAGGYDKLRAFIREIEGSQQFVVIESVSVVPADNPSSEDEDDERRPASVLPPNSLTLEIALTAYFQSDAGWNTIQEIASAEAVDSGA